MRITITSKRLLLYLAISAVPLMFMKPIVEAYARFLYDYVLYPLQIDALSNTSFLVIAIIVTILPPLIVVAALSKVKWDIQIDGGSNRTPLESLESAKKSLSDSIDYLNKLEEEIGLNVKKHQELSELVDTLNSVSKEQAEDLQKKLKAIEYLNKGKELRRIIIGFILGIIASLVASAIWTMMGIYRR